MEHFIKIHSKNTLTANFANSGKLIVLMFKLAKLEKYSIGRSSY